MGFLRLIGLADDPAVAVDRLRYQAKPGLREQSWWSLRVYRLGRQIDALPASPRKLFLTRVWWIVFRVVETATGISLPKEAIIGEGFRIHHFGGIVIHPDSRIGRNVTIRHGVTVGERRRGDGVPEIKDDVEIGAYAQILGNVTVGRGAKVGALALVVKDVPDGGVVRGATGELVPPRSVL